MVFDCFTLVFGSCTTAFFVVAVLLTDSFSDRRDGALSVRSGFASGRNCDVSARRTSTVTSWRRHGVLFYHVGLFREGRLGLGPFTWRVVLQALMAAHVVEGDCPPVKVTLARFQGYRIWISGDHFRGQLLLSIANFGGYGLAITECQAD